jgi:hypothetical protein
MAVSLGGPELVAKHFVVAYYHCLIYKPQDIVKFYEPSSALFRSPSAVGATPADIRLPEGAQFHVLDYKCLPWDQGFGLVVTGTVMSLEGSHEFTQAFTVIRRGERFTIVTDCFCYPGLATEKAVRVGPWDADGRQRPAPGAPVVHSESAPVYQYRRNA